MSPRQRNSVIENEKPKYTSEGHGPRWNYEIPDENNRNAVPEMTSITPENMTTEEAAMLLQTLATPTAPVDNPRYLDTTASAAIAARICHCKEIASRYGIERLCNACRDRLLGERVDPPAFDSVRGSDSAIGYPSLATPIRESNEADRYANMAGRYGSILNADGKWEELEKTSGGLDRKPFVPTWGLPYRKKAPTQIQMLNAAKSAENGAKKVLDRKSTEARATLDAWRSEVTIPKGIKRRADSGIDEQIFEARRPPKEQRMTPPPSDLADPKRSSATSSTSSANGSINPASRPGKSRIIVLKLNGRNYAPNAPLAPAATATSAGVAQAPGLAQSSIPSPAPVSASAAAAAAPAQPELVKRKVQRGAGKPKEESLVKITTKEDEFRQTIKAAVDGTERPKRTRK